MGRASELMIELQQEEALDEIREWITENIGEVEEGTTEWYNAQEAYEEAMMFAHLHTVAEDYDDYYFNRSDNYYVKNKSRFEILQESLHSSSDLNEIDNLEDIAEMNLKIMIFGHIVSAVEGYLSFTFIDEVMRSEDRLKKLVETDPEFSKRKFTMKEFFQKQEDLKEDVKSYLKGLIFHNLSKVKVLYKNVLGIEFGNTDYLYKAIEKRHDCVHRAGYNKDGDHLRINTIEIKELIEDCTKLIDLIEAKLKQEVVS